MLCDLNLPLDDCEPRLHLERVAELASRGFSVVAAVHTAAGRLAEADRARTNQYTFNNAGLAAANPEARHVLALRTGSLAASSPSLAALRPMWIPPPPPPLPQRAPKGVRGTSAPAQSAAIGASAQSPAARPGPDLLQLTRLNLVTSDPVHAAQLQPRNQGFGPGGGGAAAGPGGAGPPGPFNEGLVTSVLRSYDIISITPKSDKVFQQACTSLEVDIISLDLTQRLGMKLKSAAVKSAMKRGIHFEICYATGLREASARRNLFSNAQALVRATRGRNLLLSSSARSAFEVRGPLDVLHMAAPMGLSRQQAQAALSEAPRAVVARAAARVAGNAPFFLDPKLEHQVEHDIGERLRKEWKEEEARHLHRLQALGLVPRPPPKPKTLRKQQKKLEQQQKQKHQQQKQQQKQQKQQQAAGEKRKAEQM